MRKEEFKGRIGRTLADSEPWFEDLPHPGGTAPNIVVVLLDDVGFAQFGCFGSDIDTLHTLPMLGVRNDTEVRSDGRLLTPPW